MSGQQSHAHHYVPQWYQRRFLLPGQSRYHYLDLNPDTVVRDRISHRRNDLLHWGPARCFYKDDLYTLRFGPATTDVMERFFFGMVDRLGMKAVTEMAEFGHSAALTRSGTCRLTWVLSASEPRGGWMRLRKFSLGRT